MSDFEYKIESVAVGLAVDQEWIHGKSMNACGVDIRESVEIRIGKQTVADTEKRTVAVGIYGK